MTFDRTRFGLVSSRGDRAREVDAISARNLNERLPEPSSLSFDVTEQQFQLAHPSRQSDRLPRDYP